LHLGEEILMSSYRFAVAAVIAMILPLVTESPVAGSPPPIAGSMSTSGPVQAAAAAAVLARAAPTPCVHRGITFFCGQSPTPGPPETATLVFRFGNPTDLPLFGDWNGDGIPTPAVFRPSTATWYLTNTANASDTPQVFAYGQPGDIPLVGDWTSNGLDAVGVYRPSTITFYLRDMATGTTLMTIRFGNPGDIPLAGDFDFTGVPNDIGVYRPSNATFYLTHHGTPVTLMPYGQVGDRPLTGNFSCRGTDNTITNSFSLFRPSNLTWYDWCFSFGMHAIQFNFRYGNPTDIPLVS
jgi:hypothetical protein